MPNGKIANYSVYDPSGFYTSADGDAPKSYGAVATIRYKDYDFALTYNTLDKEKHIYKNAGYGQKVKNTQGEVVTNTTFPIQDSDFDGKYEPVKVLIDGQKISVYKYLTQEEGTLVAEFDNAVCNCRPADYQTIEVDTKLEQLLEKRSNGESQYWFYDVKNNKIVVILNYTGGRVLGKNSGGTIDLDELKQKNAEIVDFESMAAFANSDYNWLANEVRSTMNEAGKYVIAGLTITAAAPYLLEAALIEEGASSLTNFTFSATSDLFFSLFIEYLTSEKDNWMDNVNWTDLFADAGLSGVQAIVPAKKGKKFVDAGIDCLSSITITDLSNIGDNIGKITVECGIGIILGWALSTKQAQKIQQWLWNLGPGKLSQIIKKKLPFVKTPADEVRVVEALKNTTEKKLPDGWSKEMVEILDTDGGKQAYEFLIKCNYDITVNNFQQLSLIYSKIGDSEQKKLETLLTQGYNADNLITSITERQSSGNVSETVNTVADELLNKTSKSEPSQMVSVENNSPTVSTLDGHQPTSKSNQDKTETPAEPQNTPAKKIADLPEDLRKQYKEEDLQKFIDKPQIVDAWKKLNDLRGNYSDEYDLFFNTEMRIQNLEKDADEPSNIARFKTTLDMSVAGIPEEWILDNSIVSKFLDEPKYWDTWNYLKQRRTPKDLGTLNFPDEVFEDFGKFEKIVNIDKDKFVNTILDMQTTPWANNTDIVIKFIDNNDYKTTWNMIHGGFPIDIPGIKPKYPDFETFEILSKLDMNQYSFNNMYKIFTEDMADDICKIIKTQGLEPRDWNILLGNFGEVINFKTIKENDLLSYLNNSSKYYDKVTEFASSNPNLRKKLKNKLEGTLQEKAKDFGEAYCQELVAKVLMYPIRIHYLKDKRSFKQYFIDNQESCFRNALSSMPSSKQHWKQNISSSIYKCILGNDYAHWKEVFTNPSNIENDSFVLLNCILNNIPTGDVFWKGLIIQFLKDLTSDGYEYVITETEIFEWIKNNLNSFFEEIINEDK